MNSPSKSRASIAESVPKASISSDLSISLAVCSNRISNVSRTHLNQQAALRDGDSYLVGLGCTGNTRSEKVCS